MRNALRRLANAAKRRLTRAPRFGRTLSHGHRRRDRQQGRAASPASAVEESRLEPLAAELSGILAWIEQLNEVDTEGVAPMASTEAVKLPMREDVVTDGGDPAVILANAPKADRGFFVVPKVVE